MALLLDGCMKSIEVAVISCYMQKYLSFIMYYGSGFVIVYR